MDVSSSRTWGKHSAKPVFAVHNAKGGGAFNGRYKKNNNQSNIWT